MTRSVEELRLESERSRAQLAATVDRLREQITDTAEDLRYKVSPVGIKSEVSEFVSRKTHSWLDTVKQQALENPMQAIAVGTAVAVPALRLARGFPLPLLMIGAGLALTSKSMRARVTDVSTPAVENIKEMANEAADRIQSFGQNAVEAASQAGRRATDGVSEAQARAAGIAKDLSDRAARMKTGLDAASETAKAKIGQVSSTVRDKATAAPETAGRMIGDYATLIAGLGVAIGAIVAASLPHTAAEAAVIGKATGGVKRAAGKAVQSRFDSAKEAVLAAGHAAEKSMSQADLGKAASHMTRDMSEQLKEAADDIVSAAFNPSQTEEKPS